MKKDMPLEGLRWSRDSGSALYDTPPNGRSRTGWGGDGYNKQETLQNLSICRVYLGWKVGLEPTTFRTTI